MKNYKKRTILFALCLCLCTLITLLSQAFLPIKESEIYSKVVRLHVIANSSSDSDQSVKLLVRDAILERAKDVFSGADITQAKLLSAENCDEIAQIANEVLKENGFDYGAEAVFGLEDYPTREYDGITFPSGRYYSLRVCLGNSEGKNWWCVLFPPLCLGVSSMIESVGGFIASSWKKPTSAFKLRLRILDLFE